MMECLRPQCVTDREDNARLKEALEKYGRHIPDCPYGINDMPCTCGLENALKGADGD